jgi:D-alanyl-D-alanine carboxypeptidase
MQRKIRALGLSATQIEEPTGLSPNNVASAEDIARVLKAAARYPQIARSSSQPVLATTVAGKPWDVRNTNGWVGLPGWDVSLSKTGYIREAGLCLGMRLRVGERLVNLVLMGAPSAAERALDVQNIAYWLNGQPLLARTRPAADRQAPAETPAAQAGEIAEGSDAAAASAVEDPATPAAPPQATAPSTPPGDDDDTLDISR